MAKSLKTLKLIGYIHKKTKILVDPPKNSKDYFKLQIMLEPIKQIKGKYKFYTLKEDK